MMKVSDELPLQFHQFELGLAAQLLVERRHGFVEQQHARPLDQGARQRHALALAARQFVRLAAAKIFELHQRQHVGDALCDPRLGETFLLEAEGHIVLDIEMREQRVALEHHVDRPPMRRHLRQIDTVEQDAAGIRPFEAGDQAEQSGLAAAGRTKQGKKLALVDIERQLVDRGVTAELLAQAFDAQQRRGRRIGPRRKAAPGETAFRKAARGRPAFRHSPCRLDSLHPCPKPNGAPRRRATTRNANASRSSACSEQGKLRRRQRRGKNFAVANLRGSVHKLDGRRLGRNLFDAVRYQLARLWTIVVA